jgi:prenyltransferase beta subunit
MLGPLKGPFLHDIISSSADWIVSLKNPDGGFPATKAGDASCAWTTAGLGKCLALADPVKYHGSIQEAVSWLCTNQPNEGGFPVVAGTPLSTDPTSDALILLSLSLRTSRKKSTFLSCEKAIRFLLSTQNREGAWPFFETESTPSTVSTSWALMGLTNASLIVDDEEIREAVSRGKQWLLSHVYSDASDPQVCGWASGEEGNPNPAPTAWAMIALSVLGEKDYSAKEPGVQFLMSIMRNDGTWEDLIERHQGLTFIRFASPYCLIALLSNGVSMSNSCALAAQHWLFSFFRNGVATYPKSSITTWPTRDCLSSVLYLRDNLTTSHCLELIEYTNTQESHLAEKTAALERAKGEMQQVRQEVLKEASEKSARILRSLFFFKVLSALLLATVTVFSIMLARINWSLDLETTLVLAGLGVAIFGIYVAMIATAKAE